MATQYMGYHETLDLHEILMFKNLCLTKSSSMSGLVQDEELSRILSDDVDKTTKQINRLQQFITDRGAQS
jgi:similar to spore coat protein